ncbi:16S rRNA pseudouridine(516) synthase [Oxalobacter vibrioformis]|uniref:Pseudouridine synthase n=1 Tax=Oxalobacter vibrioformis TaxID=933080 RepID=A0A9E9P4A6_9BURK|nr:16S rRNA pseudouridine(516) synthase [Oxalobacter vibrioformis]NLC23270.1 16S rRNA pseudouridine(516) synthase [Oxalobacter sp.]WAW11085.1 16S rRNA pseudouridine(516) synthase [Oxalobacter vibrioformis]
MTLEKLLQSQGFGSRKTCRTLISEGRVSVAGKRCTDPQANIDTDNLFFEVDKQRWRYRERVYIAMHKPPGFECSHQPQHHPSVFSLLPEQLIQRGVQCAGRLDQDTTGLLFFSDDGAFIHAMISPKKMVSKIYEARVRHALQPELFEALCAGVLLHGEKSPVAALSCTPLDSHRLSLSIAEGKYHQVKRMVAAAGNRVEKLHRSAIGSLVLDESLPQGNWRWIEADELSLLGYVPA